MHQLPFLKCCYASPHIFFLLSLCEKKNKKIHTQKNRKQNAVQHGLMTHIFKGFCSKHFSTIANYFCNGLISLSTFSRKKKKCRILWFQLLKCENDAFFYSVNWTVRNRQKVFNHCQSIWWLFSWLTGIQLPSSGGLKRKVTLSDCNPTHEPTNTQKQTN